MTVDLPTTLRRHVKRRPPIKVLEMSHRSLIGFHDALGLMTGQGVRLGLGQIGRVG